MEAGHCRCIAYEVLLVEREEWKARALKAEATLEHNETVGRLLRRMNMNGKTHGKEPTRN